MNFDPIVVFVLGVLTAGVLSIRDSIDKIVSQLSEIKEVQDKILSKLNSIDKS